MKIGLIGIGKFGQKRLKACLSLKPNLEVVGVADTNPNILEQIKSRYNLPTYSSHEILLEKNKPDLVIISTPNIFHKQIAIDSISAGAHVLCEKPLATNSQDALEIHKISQKNKKFVKLGSNHRFFPNIKKSLELVKQNKIGEILSIRAQIGHNGQLIKNSWFWNKKLAGGGAMIDNGSHLIDIFREMMGGFESVIGHTSTSYWHESEVEDYANAIFITPDNKQASLTATWTQWAGYLEMEIWGSTGYITISNNYPDLLNIGNKNKDIPIKTYDFSSEPHQSYQEEITEFVNNIKQKKQPSPNSWDGYEILKMIEAVYQSQNRVVKI